MSSIIKSVNINYSESPVEIKSRSKKLLLSFEEAEKNIDMSIEEQRKLIFFELEEKKNSIIKNAEIEARVKAEKVYEQIVNDARKEAELIANNANATLQDALNKSQSIAEEAYQEGYNKGYSELSGKIEEANQIFNSITKERTEIMAGLNPEIIELISELFKKVVGVEVQSNNELIINLISKTIKQFGLKHSLTVNVSETDYENVIANKSMILEEINGIEDFQIQKSEAIKPGGCVIKTVSGEIDSSISTQLNNISKVVEDFMRNEING